MFDLLDHLEKGTPLTYDWKLPSWIYDPILLENLPDRQTLELYTVYHDCGKPYCLTYDEDGRKHFPNHAEVSFNTFNQIFDNDVSADLIRRDMDFHLLRADSLQKFSEYKYYNVLMLSALSEIHSNAIMFGGKDSTSFKIKWKHSDKRGRQVLNLVKLNINKN
tara:strand:- start:4222 stop:4710 length:489 start_codon:yes stop_codon:yes gene_type:complete